MEKKSKARSKRKQPLVDPNTDDNTIDVNRDEWIKEITDNFVAPGKANRDYYKVIIETLWPSNHGIPGPHITEDTIRSAINKFRKNVYKKDTPYLDVFRRVRELQGEEGITGITKQGKTYQLVDLELSDKKVPRTGLSDEIWEKVLEKYQYKCAVCNKGIAQVSLQQDHKVPRSRSGNDEEINWQPLCDECNIQKSTFCRGCELDCSVCGWAFPESYKPIRLSSELTRQLRSKAVELEMETEDLAEGILKEYLKKS